MTLRALRNLSTNLNGRGFNTISGHDLTMATGYHGTSGIYCGGVTTRKDRERYGDTRTLEFKPNAGDRKI